MKMVAPGEITDLPSICAYVGLLLLLFFKKEEKI